MATSPSVFLLELRESTLEEIAASQEQVKLHTTQAKEFRDHIASQRVLLDQLDKAIDALKKEGV